MEETGNALRGSHRRVIRQGMADRRYVQRQSPVLTAVASITKAPIVADPPRTVTIVELRGGTVIKLTEDKIGKINYELKINQNMVGDALYYVTATEYQGMHMFIGSRVGAKRLR